MLKEVEISQDSKLQSIGVGAFSYCINLESIRIPSNVQNIGSYAFTYCTSLKTITIPASVQSIGNSAFSRCYKLLSIIVAAENNNYLSIDGALFNKQGTRLLQYPIGAIDTKYTLPPTVASIASGSFAGCANLQSITIPFGTIDIGSYAFSECRKLTKIIIPDSMLNIEKMAFSYCAKLKSIVIPDSVVNIGDYAFYYCTDLAKVTVKSPAPPKLGENIFDTTADNLKIYVPRDSLSEYKEADKWKEYGQRIYAYD